MWLNAPEKYVRIQPIDELDPPPEFDEPVEFTENGKANVPEPVAEFLIENYDDITENEDN
jgi:hypothetical protein